LGEGSNAVQHCLWVMWERGVKMRGRSVKQHRAHVSGRQGKHKDKKILLRNSTGQRPCLTEG